MHLSRVMACSSQVTYLSTQTRMIRRANQKPRDFEFADDKNTAIKSRG